MTFQMMFISFLAFLLVGCGESGTPGGSGGPGVTASISLNTGATTLAADGKSSTAITAVLTDSVGAPVYQQTSVVFNTNLGTFRNGSKEYRTKTADDTGTVIAQLTAEEIPGNAEVWVEANNIRQKVEIKFFDPHKVGTITLRTGSASITADGKSQVSIIATVNDALGNPEEGATVNFKTTLGQFIVANPLPGIINRHSSAITDVDGEATVMLMSGTTIGTASILASLNGLNASASVIFTADEPSSISLRAAPSTIRPNGTTNLFAKIKDSNGNPVEGQTVVFSEIINASEGTLNSLSSVTNVNGEAQVTYTAGKDPGADIIQAALSSDLGMKTTTTIVVDPGATVIGGIDVTAGSASLVADGKGKVKIRAVVTDIDGNPAIGKTVNFTTTAGTLSSASAITSEIGLAEAMLQATTIAGPVTVEGECDGFIAQVSVELIPGPAHHILMYAFPDIVPPNGAFSTAAIVQDQYDNRIDDQRLMLQVRKAGGTDVIDSAELTPDQAEDGVFRFDWTAAIAYGPGNLEITARVNNGVSKTVTVVVDETATIVGAITVIAGAEEIKADGMSSVLIRATVLDYNGAPAQGITVDFSTTLGSLSSQQKKTDANGIADVMLKAGTTWGTATVTANANGFWGKADVRFTSLKANGVSLIAMPQTVQPGKQATVIAELRDATGAPVPNEVLYFDIYENNTNATLSAIQGTTDTNGRATVIYTAGINTEDLCGVCACSGDRIRVVLASDSAKTDTTCVEVAAAPLGSIELTTSLDALPADGTSTTNLRATVTDANGNPAVGVSIAFTTTAGAILTTPVVTDAFGIADTILRAADTAGTALVTATNTATGFSATLEITFGSGAPETVTVTPVPKNLTADGVSTSIVNFEVRDIDGNPVTGATLVLSVDYGTLSSLSVVTENGKATVTYTAPSSQPTGGIANITATTTNGRIGTSTISLTGTLVASITLSAVPTTLPANGTSQAIIQALVTAVGGGNVPDGTEVAFEIIGGAGGTVNPATATTAAGKAFTFLTSGITPGTATIRATAGGRIAEINVVYTAGSVELLIIPNSLLGTGAATSVVTATVLDVNGVPQAGVPVTLALSDLSMGSIITANPANTGVNGKAVFTFQSKQKGGSVTVTATSGGGLTAAGTIDIQPPPAFIQVAAGYPNPTSINIKGTGGQSTSQIVFEVKDISGNPVADGYRVDLAILDGPNGGEAIEPTTALTSGGKISTILRSGSKSGPVSIKAVYYYNTNVSTVTAQIAISAGPPVGEEFGIFAQYLNISGLWKANLLDLITTNVGDIYGNAVPNGTAISFKTYNTGGFFTPNTANTLEGLATNTLHSGGSYTAPQGFMIATAEANNGGRTTHITSIAITPSPFNNIIYVGTDGGGVYKSSNSGASWINVSRSSELGKEAQNYIDPYVNSICVDPDNWNHVYAATGYLGRGNIYRSIDGGITWLSGDFEKWDGLLSTDNAILTLTCDATTDYIWAGTDGLGAIFSPDGETFHWGGLVDSGPTCAGTGCGGGADMTGVSEGSTEPELSVTTKTETWTATYTQVGGAVSNLNLVTPSGSNANGTLSPLSASSTSVEETWTLRYLGNWTSPAAAASGATLIISSIGSATVSETWTVWYDTAVSKWHVVGSVSGGQSDATSFIPYTLSNKLTFYIAGVGAAGDSFTFSTTADSWTVTGSVSGLQATRAKTNQTYTSNNGRVSFRINPGSYFYRNPDRFTFDTTPTGEWVVKGSVSGTQTRRAQTDLPYVSDNKQVYFTIVEGATPYVIGAVWTFHATESGLGYGKIVRDIVKASGNGASAVLYAATASGVYRSINGGILWTPTTRFTGDNITCLANHPVQPQVIYAGTEDAGVWYTTNGGTSWTQYNTGLGGGLSASAPVASLSNIGNGVMSNMAVVIDTKTENWTVRCTTAAANGGTFSITGTVSGNIGTYDAATNAFTPGTIPANYVGFVINAGTTDFAVNDAFTFQTTRDPGTKIKDLMVDSDAANRRLYAITYFDGTYEPHAVGNVYSVPIFAGGAPDGTSWVVANTGLPQYDPPDDTSLFPQHALAIDRTAPIKYYIGGEGINLSKATTGLVAGSPAWTDSKSGLTNLIMARMPVLFTGPCSMEIADIEYDADTGVYTYTIYIEDVNGNPPIVGSKFSAELLDADGKLITVLRSVEYPDTYVYQGTWRDPTDPDTNDPFIIRVNPLPTQKVYFNFTPLCQDTAPGCSGSAQEITYSY